MKNSITAELARRINAHLEEVEVIIHDCMAENDRIATGKSLLAMATEVGYSGGKAVGVLTGPPHWESIERGASPEEARRQPNFFGDITEWAKARKIANDSTEEGRRIVQRIANSILKHGTAVYQMGGEDVFSTEVENYVKDVALDDLTNVAAAYSRAVIDDIFAKH